MLEWILCCAASWHPGLWEWTGVNSCCGRKHAQTSCERSWSHCLPRLWLLDPHSRTSQHTLGTELAFPNSKPPPPTRGNSELCESTNTYSLVVGYSSRSVKAISSSEEMQNRSTWCSKLSFLVTNLNRSSEKSTAVGYLELCAQNPSLENIFDSLKSSPRVAVRKKF